MIFDVGILYRQL